MFRVIREIQPSWIIGENVYGLVNWNGGLVFDQVQSDLEAEGYEVWAVILPACAVNAPHRRDRVWIVSRLIPNPGGNGLDKYHKSSEGFDSQQNRMPFDEFNPFHGSGITTNTNNPGSRNRLRTNGIREAKNNGRQKQPQPEFGQNSNAWDSFPTQPPVCGRNDGLSSKLDGITFPKWRNESIKGYGNAWVPQVAYEIFKVIEQINQ